MIRFRVRVRVSVDAFDVDIRGPISSMLQVTCVIKRYFRVEFKLPVVVSWIVIEDFSCIETPSNTDFFLTYILTYKLGSVLGLGLGKHPG